MGLIKRAVWGVVYTNMDMVTKTVGVVLLVGAVVPALLHIYTRIIADAVYKSKAEYLTGLIRAGTCEGGNESNG